MKGMGGRSRRMGEGRGTKEQTNGDKSPLKDKSLGGSTLWVVAKHNKNKKHDGIS